MAVQLGGAYGKIEIDVSGVERSAAAAAAAMSSISKASAGMSGGFAAVAKDAKAFESNFQQAGQALAGISAGLMLAGGAAVKSAGEFEGSMNVFQATARATGKQMEQVGDLAKALGADMSLPATSAVGAGKAMTELAKAGLSVNDAMAAAKGTLQLAIAGQLSEAEAASIAAGALNSFKLAGDDATRVANLLAAAYTASGSSVGELGLALKQSSAVYAAAGIPIEDLTTAIAEMGRQGIRSMDAGTSLKTMLLSLQAPTSTAKGLMDELGIKVYGAQGAMLPFRDVIGNVQGALKGLTEEQRNAALAAIFGTDAVRAANIVVMGGVEAFDKMKESVTAAGAAGDLSAARMKGLTGATENLKSQVETASLSIGQALSPAVMGLANKLSEAVAAFNEFSPATQSAVAGGLAVTAALTGATGAFILIAPKIVEAVGAMGQFVTFSKEVGVGLQLMRSGFGAAEVASTGFAGSLAVALPVVIAVTAALIAAYKAYELHVEIQKKTTEVGGAYAQMLKDQVAAGKSGEDIMGEYAAAQERVNQAYEAAPGYLKPFIDKQALLNVGAKDYVKILGETNLSQTAYEAEARKSAAAMGLEVDATGNLVRVSNIYNRVTGKMVESGREIVQANYMMAESQRIHTSALEDANRMYGTATYGSSEWAAAVNSATAVQKQSAAGMRAAAEAADDLRDAQAGLADEALSIAQSFADGNSKYIERADLTTKLADLDAEIVKNGPAHLGLIKARTMSEAELKKEQGALLYLGQELGAMHRNQGETDVQLAARTDELTKKYADYKTRIGEATGVLNTHIGTVGGATQKQQEERQAILDKIAAMDLEIQKEFAQQAVASLTPAMFGTGAAGAAAYAAAKRDLMLATGLVTKESLAEKDSIDLLTAAMTAGQITPEQYALALGNVKGASADGTVSIRELTGSIASLSGTKFDLKNMDDVRKGIVGPLNAAKVDAVAAGADITAGLGQGVTSNVLAFSGALKGVVDSGVQGMRLAYQMQSPSLVMAGIGGEFLQGLTNGVIEGRAILEPEIIATGALFTDILQPTLTATATLLSGLLVDAFTAAAKAMRSLIDDQLVPTAAAFGGVAAMASVAEEAIRGAARAASSFSMPNFGGGGGGSAPAGGGGSTPAFAYGGETGAGGLAQLHPNEFVLSEKMRKGLQPLPAGVFSGADAVPITSSYASRGITIYGGLSLYGVQDTQGLLSQLQAMS